MSEYILSGQTDRWNFNILQRQQLTTKHGSGKKCITLHRFHLVVISNKAFEAIRWIIFHLKRCGCTKVLHPSNIKTFCLPVAHKTAELFEPTACFSGSPFFSSLHLSLFPCSAPFHRQMFFRNQLGFFTSSLCKDQFDMVKAKRDKTIDKCQRCFIVFFEK